jgi:hypothetical protein
MKQFINRNNAYGSKVVSHTITKSLIIPSDSMAWKNKANIWQPPCIKVKVKNIRILITSIQCSMINKIFNILKLYAMKEKNKQPVATKEWRLR